MTMYTEKCIDMYIDMFDIRLPTPILCTQHMYRHVYRHVSTQNETISLDAAARSMLRCVQTSGILRAA